MIKFLIFRPIAVTMTMLAIMVLGLVAIRYLPVSLMPDIDIPEVTVQISGENMSARELEDNIVRPFRNSLQTVTGLDDMSSETRDESSLIKLRFNYGTDIDLAFIDVNEKIDQQMSQGTQVDRPRVVKASAADIPVFYLEVTLNEASAPDSVFRTANTPQRQDGLDAFYPVTSRFVEMSNFTAQVIRKRLEQLPEVALVDMSGRVYPELLVLPDMKKMESLNITLGDLQNRIQTANSASVGNLTIREGQYEFNVSFSNPLSDRHDIEDVYLKADNRLLQVKDVATVIEHPQDPRGLVVSDGKDAITLAIIKQSDARMDDLKEQLDELIAIFRTDYPNLSFTVTRDQTRLLDYSISNLYQGLIWGGILALFSMAVFLRDIKSPLLIAIIMPMSLIVSLILFYVVGISINIISLSGLVLGIGMMIDNAIIVIDNISQHRERGAPLSEACWKGAGEVSAPMLSSVLTTCAVFIPLIFLSGMAGALFYDEAMAVTIGAVVSLLLSVTFIPVYYRLINLREERKGRSGKNWLGFLDKLNYEEIYEKGFRFVMRRQGWSWFLILLLLGGGAYTWIILDKQQLPAITEEEMVVLIDWNERINVQENKTRTINMMNGLRNNIENYTALIGEQQFLLEERHATSSEVMIYVKAMSPEALNYIRNGISQQVTSRYSDARLAFENADNIFNLIFSKGEHPLTARIIAEENFGPETNNRIREMMADIKRAIPEARENELAWQDHIVLRTDPVKMMAYGVSGTTLQQKVRSAFNDNEIMKLADNQTFVPVVLGDNPRYVQEIIANTFVPGEDGVLYPAREFLIETRENDLKTIVADQNSEYIPVHMNVGEERAESITEEIKALLLDKQFFRATFSGSILSNRELMGELTTILLVSLALLYFILSAQFESLKLPLIILLEIPIDIAAAFIFLYVLGDSINLLSMIGLVVMGGIIINDSILKIDTINKLHSEGHSLLKAIALGGRRRLKPIIMTSLTTIVAMVPIMFLGGLGAELQRPMAIVLIGGMGVGTIISLYFIPLCYYYLMRGKKQVRA